jgi:hypothetical protein
MGKQEHLNTEAPKWGVASPSFPLNQTQTDYRGVIQVGGRLKGAHTFWHDRLLNSTHHHQAKAVLEGVRWNWIEYPPLTTNPVFIPPRADPQLSSTLAEMLEQGVIRRVTTQEIKTPGYYSPVFTVPKPGKTERRFIFNLKRLNKMIHCPSFKMERLTDALSLINQNDWLTSLDLTQAYHHIPVHPQWQRYLRFLAKFEDDQVRAYQYTCLPMGMNVSPRIYQKTMKVVVEQLRTQGIRCCVYMDDLLIIASSKEESNRMTQLAAQLITQAGFLINQEKSETIPTQTIRFLGVEIDTRTMIVRIPDDKLTKARNKLNKILLDLDEGRPVTVRTWASLIGTIGSLRDAIAETRMYLVHIQRDKQEFLDQLGWEAPMTISAQAWEELMFWKQHLTDLATKGRRFQFIPHDITLATDASELGYGAMIESGAPLSAEDQDLEFQGQWSDKEADRHNNWRELRAAVLAIQHFSNKFNWRQRKILVRTDNTVTLAYLNRLGGKIPHLNEELIALHKFCKARDLTLVAEYIPGIENVIADQLSREIPSEHREWSLPQDLFNQIQGHLPLPMTIDLFASEINRKTSIYLSLKPEPESNGVNAMSHHWGNRNDLLYANPPFTLIPKILQKIQIEAARVLLVTPVWPTAVWWPTLINLCMDLPIILNCTMQSDLNPSKANCWTCAAWTISGDTSERTSFRRTWQDCYSPQVQARKSPWPLVILHGKDSPQSQERLIYACEQIISSLTWSTHWQPSPPTAP